MPLVECVLYLSQVSGADGQIGRIEGEALTLTALNGLVLQPTAGMIERVGGALLVFQGVAPDITFPAGILLPGAAAGIGWYLTDKRGQQADDESYHGGNTHNGCKVTKFF